MTIDGWYKPSPNGKFIMVYYEPYHMIYTSMPSAVHSFCR